MIDPLDPRPLSVARKEITMKIYTYPGAPNPRRVDIYLAEKGIDVPRETVDIMKGRTRSPEFVEKINPAGGVPVLELDDGSHISESVAICRYFEALHPTPPLFGSTPEEIARIEMWNRRIELGYMMPVGMVWLHGSPLTKSVVKNQIAEVAEANRAVVRRYHQFLDGQLATRDFIAGDAFTMADILALTTTDFASTLVKVPYDPSLANLHAWHERISSRPSANAGLVLRS
jgi:glutathione S-transferase